MKLKIKKLKIKKLKKHKITFSGLGLIYILSMTVAELHQTGLFNWYYLTPILIGIFWAGIGFLKYIYNSTKGMLYMQIKKVGKLLIFPWIIFILYNILIYSLGVGYKPFFKSSFVQIMFVPCIILGALGSYYIFRKNTLKYFLYSVFLQYTITLIILLFRMGPANFITGVFGIFSGNSVSNPFEQNSDMLFALGLLVIFYFDNFIKNKSTESNHAVLILILVLLGGKRIELLALLVICLASMFTRIMIEKNRNRVQTIISTVLLISMYIFVYLVIKGKFSEYIYSHNINAMGRMRMWDYVAQYTQFNPTYMGKGYSFSNLILELNEVLTYNGKVYVLHSDILKIFYDLGFVMFSFWGVYHLFVIPHCCRKKFGYEFSNLIWTLMSFLFVSYFTDNVATYFISQTVLVIILLQYIMRKNEEIM